MTTACASSPQVMRDRLLQALDAQSDICNPVLVVEIFSLLEKYPITREVLEETRLGKLVNDVRKKTKNTDVARRAKKLLLTWQKFIEPGGSNSTADQASSVPATPLTPPTSKVGSELKDRSDFNNCSSANGKNHHSNRTQTPPTKKSRKSLKSDAKDGSSGRVWNNGSEPDRLGRLPATALKPHPSARELPPQTALEEVISRKHCRPRSPQQQQPQPLQSTLVDPDSHYADKPNLGLSFQSIHRSDGKLADSNYDNKLASLSLHAVYTRGKKSKRKNKDPCSDLSSDGKLDTKTLGFKERGLTFNPVTGQINPLFSTSSLTKEELREDPVPHPETAERPTHTAYDPLKQTVYKELSHNAIVQSYLRQQSSLLSSSGNRAVGSSATENGGDRPSATRIERHELAPEPPVADLPGISREVRSRDMDRLHTLQWSGVNGCYDNKGSWFDWTKCITLDPHGDEGRLNVLPYVCLD